MNPPLQNLDKRFIQCCLSQCFLCLNSYFFLIKLVWDSFIEIIVKEHYNSVFSQNFFKINWPYFCMLSILDL